MKNVVFFNNKGGVGKTSLVYHLAWMYADLGLSVVAADLDPQANLTSMFLEEDRVEELWPDGEHALSVLGAIRPILRGTGDIETPHVEPVADRVGLVVGDLGLSAFEDKLSDAWPRCLDRDESAFRVISSLYRLTEAAGRAREADMVLIDVGPNLGAINRAAIIAARFVVVPLAPDLYSLQGLRNLGPTLRRWREEWRDRHDRNPEPALDIPDGVMEPAGYVLMQHAVRGNRPVRAYERWMRRVPREYRESVLQDAGTAGPDVMTDPHCLATVKHFRSLMPLAMDARKPMFFLKPADGAIGAHMAAVTDCYRSFHALALRIAERCGIVVPVAITQVADAPAGRTQGAE